MKTTNMLLLFLLGISFSLLVLLPGASEKKTILIFFLETPFWLFLSYRLLPKKSASNESYWFKKLIFASFLGLGLSILFFVFSLLFLAFALAVSGKEGSQLYLILFLPLHGISLYIASYFHRKEIERIKMWGFDYWERQPDEDEISTQGMGETLLMLNILGLDSDFTKKDLKDRYRELAKLYHPDRLSEMNEADRKVAEREFKRINAAYNMLLEKV